MSSDALFYVDADGKKQDRAIHERWIAEGDEAGAMKIGMAAARRAGLSEEQIHRLYGTADGVTDKMPPRSLYVRRDVTNGAEILKHFSDQGLEDLVSPEELHVTVCYSRAPVEWAAVGESFANNEDGGVRVRPGGPRYVDRFGPEGDVIVQVFASSDLSWRHRQILDEGASWDFEEYMPHVTIVSGAAPEINVAEIEPWRGEIVLGPEVFEEVKE